jgi:RNA-directed DNA polymerase
MGLIGLIRTLLGKPAPAVRDISAMADVEEDRADAVQETIETRPEPLKPHHRRMTYRDPRLLPKRRTLSWPGRRKKKVLPDSEARRLFAATMRTANRSIRDLDIDVDQLARHDLPQWRTEADLAAALELSVSRLRHFSIHRQRERTCHYVAFAIAKRGGGRRIIHAPKKRLKAVQRRLDQLLVRRLPVSPHAHGFVAGRSVASNARPHVGREVVVKMDLKDCFPTIHFGRVRGLLIALGYGFPVATALAVLMTEAPRQRVSAEGQVYHVPVGPRVCVQGAPTSPGLCNAVLLRLDRRLAGLAKSLDLVYTRYADDLTFSGDRSGDLKRILTLVPRIVRDEGFRVNPYKTRVMRRSRRQQVTGVVVNDQAGLSRRERRRMRARLHRWGLRPEAVPVDQRRRMAGRLAYLNMLNPAQAAPLIDAFSAITATTASQPDRRTDGAG